MSTLPIAAPLRYPRRASTRKQRRASAAVRAAAACACAGLVGCASTGYPIPHYQNVFAKAALGSPAPEPGRLAHLDAAQVNRGRYLVNITGCAACHTDGALVGQPDAAKGLAGSDIGIAYTNPMLRSFPGVVYPSNLTPDRTTGLGDWTDAQIEAAIRTGSPAPGSGPVSAPGHSTVMPWPLYRDLTDDDVKAIVAYLRSIPPVAHRVPKPVAPGTRASTPYVYFGVLRSGPAIKPPEPLR